MKNITNNMAFWNGEKWKNINQIAVEQGLDKAELFKSKKYCLRLYLKNSKISIYIDDISYNIICREIDIFKFAEGVK